MTDVVPPEEMSLVQLEDWIDILSQARNRIRGDGLPTDEITAEIDQAYDIRRRKRAHDRHGPADIIVARARVERELEKLMTED